MLPQKAADASPDEQRVGEKEQAEIVVVQDNGEWLHFQVEVTVPGNCIYSQIPTDSGVEGGVMTGPQQQRPAPT